VRELRASFFIGTIAAWGHAARLFDPPPGPRWSTPGQLAVTLDPHTRQTPALDLIDQAIVETAATPDGRLIISMPHRPRWRVRPLPERTAPHGTIPV
jgi:hypothetical protein